MTREDVKKIFPDATEEQISNFLNQSNADVAKEKSKTQSLKEKADKADELQKRIDAIEQQNMTELEKEKKRADDAEALAAERAIALTMAKVTSVFAEAGMVGDTYKGAIKAFSAMSEEDSLKEATTFVNGISEIRKTALEAAKSEWESEKLKNTPNPGGNTPPSNEDESAAAKYAKEYSQKMNPQTDNTSVSF